MTNSSADEIASPRPQSAIARASNLMAGVDSATLAKCPRTDQLSISILGAWMIVTFAFIAALNFYSLNFVMNKPWHAIFAAVGMSISIFFADRIILAWSWFASEKLRLSRSKFRDASIYLFAVIVRIIFSVALSLFVGIFFMLAFFDDRISEKAKLMHRSENTSFYEQRDRFLKDYDTQTELLRQSLKAASESHSKYLGNAADIAIDIAIPEALTANIARRTADRDRLRREVESIETEIKRQIDIQTGEIEGTKHAGSGDRRVDRGNGPIFRSAQRRERSARRELLEKQAQLRDVEASLIAAQKEALNFQNSELERRKQAQRDVRDEMLAAKNDTVALQTKLADRELEKGARIIEFENSLRQQVGFRDVPTDALTRMIAWMELKSDEKNGPAIWWFSMAVGIFVSLIEMMPVLIKLLFFPPNAYSTHVYVQVLLARKKVLDSYNAESDQNELDSIADSIKGMGERFRRKMEDQMASISERTN